MWAAARHASIGQACDAGHMSTSTVFAPVEYLAAVQYQASFLSSLGHAIVARALFTGLQEAVREMKRLMSEARL